MNLRYLISGCAIAVLASATLAAQTPILSNIEAPYPAVQSQVRLAGNTYGRGAVAYGPVNTPLVVNGAYMGTGGTVQFTGYYKNASGQEVAATTVEATVTMWTPTMLFFYVPAGAVSGLITVIVDGRSSNALPFLVTPGSYGGSCPANATSSQVQITTSALPNGAVGQSYSSTLEAIDGVAPYTWSVTSGTLPAGLSLSSSGVISGTPSSPSGELNFTVTAVDSRSQSADAVLSLSVDSLTLTAGPVYSYSNVSYDGAGNLLGYTDSVNGTWSDIGYDPLSRLTQAAVTPVGGSPLSFIWSYDSFGNRISQQESSSSGALLGMETASYNGANQITTTNARGVAWTPGYDGAGNLTSDGVNTYLYDAEGRICAMKSSAMPSMSLMTGYLYDANGARVAKGTITTMSCDPTKNGFQFTKSYVLGPGGEELTTLDGSNTWLRTNVYVGGKLMATYDQAGLHFHLSDPLGTRRVQLSGNLTSSDQTLPLGQAELDCTSLPFGDQQSCVPAPNAPPTSDDATPLHFTSKERDAESGNDYFGARYYASSMGRWLSPDPGWFFSANMLNPQSLNLYNYALNNPLAFLDLDGLELVRAVLSNGQSVVVDRSIAPEVMSLLDDAQAAGLRVTVTSGFRSNLQQAQMYNAWIQGGRRGNPVARPGHSGHNSGQSIDISTRNMNAAQRNQLGALGRQNGLPYAGARDPVHFGAGFGNPMDPQLVIENNAHPYPDSTIVDGGVTTVVVSASGTQIDTENSTVIPVEITPIDTQNLQLTPQPMPPPPPPPQCQNSESGSCGQ